MDYRQSYRPEESDFSIADGEHYAKIVGVKEKEVSGTMVIEVCFAVKDSAAKLQYSLWCGEYFNVRATQLFDAFGIERGNFNFPSWDGKYGRIMVGKNKSGYSTVKYPIVPSRKPTQSYTPPKQAPVSPRQESFDSEYATRPDAYTDFKEDVPF